MSDFVIENGVLKEYKGIGGDVFIPNSVKTIGDWAFQGYPLLTSVTIPDSVTKIGSHAFDRCTSLTSVIIPNSVTYIAKCAFYGCTSLTSVIIPDSVKKLGRGAFKNTPFNDMPHEEAEEIAEYLPPEPEPQFDDIDSEEKFHSLMVEVIEEDNPSALPPLEKFSMYLTPQKVKEYLYLCVDKKSRKVSTLLWDYMETDSYILEDYKETKNKKFLAHIKEHFEKFMDSAIAQNDIEAVQEFAQEDGLFTAENIDEYLHKCIDKRKNQILMILLDYKENHFPE